MGVGVNRTTFEMYGGKREQEEKQLLLEYVQKLQKRCLGIGA